MSYPKTLLERMRVRLESRHDNEDGLALLDVLIGMAIFALIAVIAVMGLGQFRQSAYATGAAEDARSLGLAIETLSTDVGGYPTDMTNATTGLVVTAATATDPVIITTGLSPDFRHILTKQNDLAGYLFRPSSSTGPATFALCIEHTDPSGAGDASAFYDSNKGGLVGTSKKEGCDAAWGASTTW